MHVGNFGYSRNGKYTFERGLSSCCVADGDLQEQFTAMRDLYMKNGQVCCHLMNGVGGWLCIHSSNHRVSSLCTVLLHSPHSTTSLTCVSRYCELRIVTMYVMLLILFISNYLLPYFIALFCYVCSFLAGGAEV